MADVNKPTSKAKPETEGTVTEVMYTSVGIIMRSWRQ